nr:glycosyl transferase family 4 [uncultured Gammaproteobacteria bacterium]
MPTPRGAGVGIVLGFALASLGLWIAGSLPSEMLVAVLGGGLLVAGIGFCDDLRHVPIAGRLLVHIAAAAWGEAWLGAPDWASALGWLLGLVWMINLYNFMDGIDGLAGVQAVCAAGAAALILACQGQVGFAAWLFGLAAACGGFLVFNWPPAKVFMGDVGSGFLGFVFGMLALATSLSGALPLWSWAILLAVFVTDAGFTLLRRMARRQRFWQAHRSHAYQKLAHRFGARTVTGAVAAIAWLWLSPLAAAAARYPELGVGWTALAYAPLLWMVWRARAGLD